MKTRTLIVCLGLAGLAAAGGYAFKTGCACAEGRTRRRTLRTAERRSRSRRPPYRWLTCAAMTSSRRFMVTGSLVAREEILVAPEVEGLRVLELKVDEGDRVKKGDVLAVLVSEQLEAQIAQNDRRPRTRGRRHRAGQEPDRRGRGAARGGECRARARPPARQVEIPVRERVRPARGGRQDGGRPADGRQGWADARRGAERAGRGAAARARSGAAAIPRSNRRPTASSAAAARASARSRSAPSSPAAASRCSASSPDGEIELDAEVAETELAKVQVGQKARVEVAGLDAVEGTVRLVSPEVDKATRLGRVRIFLGDDPALKIGCLRPWPDRDGAGRATSPCPNRPILYGDDGPTVQVVEGGKVATRRIETGLSGRKPDSGALGPRRRRHRRRQGRHVPA